MTENRQQALQVLIEAAEAGNKGGLFNLTQSKSIIIAIETLAKECEGCDIKVTEDAKVPD